MIQLYSLIELRSSFLFPRQKKFVFEQESQPNDYSHSRILAFIHQLVDIKETLLHHSRCEMMECVEW